MKHTLKKLAAGLLALVLVAGSVPVNVGTGGIWGGNKTGITAYAEDTVKYLEGAWDAQKGKCLLTEKGIENYTVLTNTTTAWVDGATYVVNSSVEITGRITVTGTVNLILCDDAALTAKSGITVTQGKTLNIYGQQKGNGTLTAAAYVSGDGQEFGAAIGGYGYRSPCGTINIHGGTVNANKYSGSSTCYAAGIGGGDEGGNGGAITVYSGTVNAYGSVGGAGIGSCGGKGNGGSFTMYGGTVTAVGGTYSGGISGGCTGSGTAITAYIYGGTLTATGCVENENTDYQPGDGIGYGSLYGSNTHEHGTLTAGTGVTIQGSSDNITWQTMTTPLGTSDTRYPYMKAEGSQAEMAPTHTHTFAYSADGATITATCSEEDCDLTNSTATLTITAPTTVGGAAGVTGDTVLTDGATIKYATKNGSEWGAPTTNVPSTAGTYQASVTLGEGEGAATASVEYSIYSVAVAGNSENGTVTVTSALALGGSKVKPTITPDAGFELETFMVNGTQTALDADGSFTMPNADVTLSATFAARSVPVKLTVTGDVSGTVTPLTASILKDDGTYQTVDTTDAEHPFTKKVGETFLLQVTSDEEYTYSLSGGGTPDILKGNLSLLSDEENLAFVEKVKPKYSGTKLVRVTMPEIASGDLTITVAFAKQQTNTVLYQANESMDAVWCKYEYDLGGNQTIAFTLKMFKEAKLGDNDVWSLKVAGTDGTQRIAFAATEAELASAAMSEVSTKQSANNEDWSTDSTNGRYLVIGGNAKTYTAAFVTDSDSLVIYDSDSGDFTVPEDRTGTTYQLAICTTDNDGNVTGAGTVTAPAPPTAPTGYDFVGWKGFVKTASGTEEKQYSVGDEISIRENTEFYSVWQPQQPGITWDMNGGTGTSGAASVTYNDKVSKPEDPVRSGFAFDCWTVGEEVVEDGEYFSKGSPFDFTKNITEDLTLVAQWKHVHSYKCFKLDDSALGGTLSSYEKYIPYLHLRYCACGDYKLEAHSYDSSGKCVSCGYAKTQIPTTVTIKYSYGIYENSTYHELFTENPEQKKKGSEISIYAPTELSEDLEFDKWEYRMDNNQSGQIDDEDEWKDLSASPMGFFVVPADMELRASYKSTSVQPQMELYSKRYNNTLVFRMNYRLPDGYTYVDSGVRAGDNAQISYYRRVEKTKAPQSVSAGDQMAEFGATAAIEFLTGGDDIFDVASDYFLSPLLDSAFDSLFGIEEKPQYTWEKREDCVLNIMSKQTLGEYMYQKKPINIPGDMLLWTSNSLTKGQAGSCYTLIPEKWGGPGNNGGNHWNYGYAFLKYKTPDGQIKTLHTDAIAATYNQIGDSTTATAN